MKLADVQSLVGRVAGVDADCTDAVVLMAGVADLRALKSWVEGREVDFAQRIAKVSSFPEKSLAEAANTSLRNGGQLLQRAETAAAMPEFGASLDAGRVSGEHLDVLSRVMRGLDSTRQARLADEGERLVGLAQQSTPDEFARSVREAARRLEAEGDGLARLACQQRDIRLVSWVDKQTGMGRLLLTLDPATFATLERRLDRQVEAMFHDRHPEDCPTDLLEKQSFLRARAFVELLNGNGPSSRRAEILVVEDHTNPLPDGRPSLDWGVDIDLPHEFLAALRPTANVNSITVRNGVIIEAPGELNLGRDCRLASRAQRRALEALYKTCAVPGCCVGYSRTKLHHITWWEHGGLTDLVNLVPLCEIHHQKIHRDGWVISLGPNRELTLALPDGQIMTTGPPRRAA